MNAGIQRPSGYRNHWILTIIHADGQRIKHEGTLGHVLGVLEREAGDW